MHLSLILFLVSILILGPTWPAEGASEQEDTRVSERKGAGEEQTRILPTFTLSDMQGRQRKSAEWQGNIVVLDFWATWCEPCIGEIPFFNELQKKYADRGVQVIGLAVQSGWVRDIKRFAAKYRMKYMILAGNDEVVSDFDVIAFPTTYLITPGWKIHKKYPGTYSEKSSEIERDIEQLLNAK